MSLLVTPGPITTVTLNRPETRNALDETLIDALTTWAESVPADGSVRVVVLEGAGPVFCAGADIRWMARMVGSTHQENVDDAGRFARMLRALDTVPVPIVARVHGAAMGGGVGLVSICDIVIAATNTEFGLTETTLGVVPAMIAPYVIRKIGVSAMRALALSGARFDAAHARTIGLLHHVAPPMDLEHVVAQEIARFGRTSPSAVRATKRLIATVDGHPPEDVVDATTEAIAAQRVSPEGQEGLKAFLEKRKPSWVSTLTPPARIDG